MFIKDFFEYFSITKTHTNSNLKTFSNCKFLQKLFKNFFARQSKEDIGRRRKLENVGAAQNGARVRFFLFFDEKITKVYW